MTSKADVDQKIDADKLPSVDDERPKFLKDPFGWYAQLSYRRPRTMFFSIMGVHLPDVRHRRAVL